MPTYYSKPSSSFTQVKATTIYGKIIQFPLCRLLPALLFMVPATMLHFGLGSYFRNNVANEYVNLVTVLDASISICLFLASYWWYCRLVERRKPAELSFNGAILEFVRGGGLGLLLMGLSLSLVLLFSEFSITAGTEGWLSLIVSLFFFATPALVEEIFFRLILFRLTEEWLGSWPAVLIQALFFGFAHAGNPSATVWSSVAIMISAGGLLAAIYMYTRQIWMVWGVHLFWNYFQSAVMGLPVSGRPGEGILTTTVTGPELITGGEFGIEASVFVVAICFAVGLFYFWLAVRGKRIVSPSWIRNKQASDPIPQD